MSATTSVADETAIIEFPEERQEFRWRGFLGAERIERHVVRSSRLVRRDDERRPTRAG